MEHLIVIAGPPCSGKGVAAQLIVQQCVNSHVCAVRMSCSDYIRQAMADQADLAGTTIDQLKGYADVQDAKIPGWTVRGMYRRALVRCREMHLQPKLLIIEGVIRLSEAYASLSLGLSHGLKWNLLYVDAPPDVMYDRLIKRNRGNDTGLSKEDYMREFVNSERGRQLRLIRQLSTAQIHNDYAFVNDFARALAELEMVKGLFD